MRISTAALNLIAAVAIWAAPVTMLAQSAHASETVPPTMKAVFFTHYGDSGVLQYANLPVPTPDSGEVLIRVRAASVNPADWKRRAGAYGAGTPAGPIIPGFDVSGTVVAVGSGVAGFKLNDAVYGIVALNRSGGYAQYAVAPATQIARKPSSLDHIHAAAVPLAALTAWQALFDAAKLHAGETVLIHGGAGGVGHFAVQLAKAKGAHVIATASTKNLQLLRELGADQAIDYQTQPFDRLVRDADVVFDTVGGETLRRSYDIVRRGGYLVGIVDDVDPAQLAAHGICGSHVRVNPNTGELVEISRLISAGKVHPRVSSTFPLDQAAQAQNLSASGHAEGKIVLIVP